MRRLVEVSELRHQPEQEPDFIGLSERSRLLYYISLLLVMLSTQLLPFQETYAQEDPDDLAAFAESLSDEELERAIDNLQRVDVAIEGDVGEVLDFAQNSILEEFEAELFERRVADLMDGGVGRSTAELIVAKEIGLKPNGNLAALGDTPKLAPDTEWLQVRQERPVNKLSDALRTNLVGEIPAPENPPNPELQEQQEPPTVLELSKFPVSQEVKDEFISAPDVEKTDEFGNHLAEYYTVPANSTSLNILPVSRSENPHIGFLLEADVIRDHAEFVISFQENPDGLMFVPIIRYVDDVAAPTGSLVGLDSSVSLSEQPLALTMFNDTEGLQASVVTVSNELLAALDAKILDADDKAIIAQLSEYDVVMIKVDEQGNLREIMTNHLENLVF